MIGADKDWQELINKYGIDKAGEYLLYILNSRRFDSESLEQPSPNKENGRQMEIMITKIFITPS